MRILVLAGERKLARILQIGLRAEQFAVDLVRSDRDAVDLARRNYYDLIIAESNPREMGLVDLLRRLRESRAPVPILVLVDRDAVLRGSQWLEAGADDYLIKPFLFEQALAHIRALLRRPAKLPDKVRVGDLEIDRARYRVTRGGKHIALTRREFALLEYLMRNTGRPVTRTMLVEHVWNDGYDGLTNIVDVYISYLRGKIDRGFATPLIHTLRGVGYLLEESGRAASKVVAA